MKRIAECHLYGILDLGYTSAETLPETAQLMIDGGVDIIQLRAKEFPEEEIQEMAERIVPVTERAGVPFIINDYPEIVPAVGAQGAHVGQDDRPANDARWRAGRALGDEVPPVIIGKSTHCIEQAVTAEADGADYIGFGPLHATLTKPGRPAIGLADIARVHELVKIPIFCIGGIKLENLASVLAAGARRVVVVSGILQAPDITAYCRALKTEILKYQ